MTQKIWSIGSILLLIFCSLVIAPITIAQTPNNPQSRTTPPYFYNIQPDPQIEINIPEGGYKDFSFDFPDFDKNNMTCQWYVDNILMASGKNRTFRYSPDYESAGIHIITTKIDYSWFNWTVNVDNTNRKPTALITTPQNNSQFDPGKQLYFIAIAKDPDNDPMTLIWYENGQEIHRTQSTDPPDRNGTIDYWQKKFPAGTTHILNLVVNDSGGLKSTYNITIIVKPVRESPPPFGGLCGYDCIIFLLSSVSMVMIVRSGRTRKYRH